MNRITFPLWFFISITTIQAQTVNASANVSTAIITAFPSLSIPSSSRSFSMGDCGIACANHNEQIHFNPAKLAFTQNFHQVQLSYTPWATGISNDTRLMNASYTATISNSSALGFVIGYLNEGNIYSRDNLGTLLSTYNASEYNIAIHYALQLNRNASFGLGFKLLSTQSPQLVDQYNNTSVGARMYTVAGDVSYYQFIELNKAGSKIEWGAALKNFGPIQSIGVSTQYLPTNLGIGFAYTFIDQNTGDHFTAAIDLNKLLVPSPNGKLPSSSIFKSLYSSFSDASGGFAEELQEIRVNAGLEYAFANQFFLRTGISYESQSKGNRQYIGLGAGYHGTINDQNFGIDIHYLVPFSFKSISPFQNCYGLTIKLGIGNFE